jgi:hypothetical protein
MPGVQVTPLEDWLEQAEMMGSEVVWLPLKPELRKESHYNPEALAQWVIDLDENT